MATGASAVASATAVIRDTPNSVLGQANLNNVVQYVTPAAGANGGASQTGDGNGTVGSAGTNGQTGGGGSGGAAGTTDSTVQVLQKNDPALKWSEIQELSVILSTASDSIILENSEWGGLVS